ncbi:hypothetical protein RRF57_007405 [Xylaria bambusicola]|uniref:Uncharacterized protein n=1 Tax=Xylaria bambusicola TaxID=326684 RepID=A0AAN7UTM1_9PEZI
MRTKLSDRERRAGGSGLGWCTLLIFADYASECDRWILQYNRNFLGLFLEAGPGPDFSYFGPWVVWRSCSNWRTQGRVTVGSGRRDWIGGAGKIFQTMYPRIP